MDPLGAEFYSISTPSVARALLGMRLVRRLDGGALLVGVITETEAYRGEEDQACHARAGRTPRTAIMYGPPGHAYIYFTYGMHWCLNIVTEREGFPAAVLIRALRVIEGSGRVALFRPGVAMEHWTDGPAKLCKAFAIDGSLNGLDLTRPNDALWIEPAPRLSDSEIQAGPRVGIVYAAEPWLSIPWRFRSN